MDAVQKSVISYFFLSYLIFFTACIQRIAPVTLCVCLTLSILFFLGMGRIRLDALEATPLPWAEKRVLLFFLLALLVLFSHVLLIPAYVRDDMIYHLLVPKQIFGQGGFKPDPYNINANFPMAFELPLTLVFAARQALSPFIVNLAALMGLCFAYYAMARRMFNVNRHLALIATGLIATTPVVYDQVHSCYVELFMSLLVLITFYHYFLFISHRSRTRHWYLAMLFAGFICAVKYFGLFYAGFILGIEFVATRDRRRYYQGALIFVAACLPWYVKNWLWMGNPLFPMFNFLFQSDHVSMNRVTVYNHLFGDYHAGRQWWDYLVLPFRLLMGYDPPAQAGQLGFGGKLSLFFASALLSLKYAAKRYGSWRDLEKNRLVMILFILYAVFWAITSQQVRFLLPVLLLSSLTGLGVISVHWHRARIVVLLVGAVVLAQNSVNIAQSMKTDRIVDLLTGRFTREQFLSHHMPVSFKMAGELTAVLDPDKDRIFAIGTFGRNYYFSIPIITNTYYETEPLVQAFQKERRQPEVLENLFRKEGITHLLINHSYLRQSLKGNQTIALDALEKYLKTLTPVLSQNQVTVYRLKPENRSGF